MTMVMQRAKYVADDGTEFSFVYVEGNRLIEVYMDRVLYMTIADVDPVDSTKKMNDFMERWNHS